MTNTDFLLYILLLSVVNATFSLFLPFLGYFDEILVVVIIICTFLRNDFEFSREMKLCVGIFIFYLVYSLIMAINVKNATFRDFMICLKPFICFYAAHYYGMNFSEMAIKRCQIIVIILGIYLWLIAPFIHILYYNPTHYYPACAYTGMLYILISDYSKKEWIIATLILLPGLLSIKAKYFAEFVLWIFIVFFLKKRIKLNISFIIIGSVLIYIIYRINYDKILLYTVNGLEVGASRTYMYVTSLEIFKDYFPFGPGFGTFGSDSAAKYYSPLNYHYGLNNIMGLNPDDDSIGISYYSDTFYPILSQFGVFGAILFIIFIKKRWMEGLNLDNYENYKIFIFILAYILIQCIAENTITGPNCIPLMIMLGLILSNNRLEYYGSDKFS